MPETPLSLQAYHRHCFCCSSCEKNLLPGEEYCIINNKLFCKSDSDLLQHEAMDSPTGKPLTVHVPSPTIRPG